MLQQILVVFHVLTAIALIAFVLLQQGKGADAGAAFGSGASSTMFGSRGAASFMSRTTALLAVGFFVTSLVLAYFAAQRPAPTSVIDRVVVEQPDVPAAPASRSDVPELPGAPGSE